MKIAIFSDSHDNIPNLEEFLKLCKQNKIEQIIGCGDLCAPGIIKNILSKFTGKIHLVFGNVADREKTPKVASMCLNVKHYGDVGKFEIDGKKIAITHFPNKAKELASSREYDFVFYGHTHKPWIEKIDACILANPGTLAGMFSRPTFAFLDTKNSRLELKDLY